MRSLKSFLLSAHLRPEGDSIGSQLGLMLALQSLGKNVVVANDDPVPDMLKFLPGSDQIITPDEVDGVPDVAVMLDCGQLERAGRSGELAKRARVLVNIDHHIDAPGIGKYNYIVDVSCHKHGVAYDGIWDAEIAGWSEHFLRFISAYELQGSLQAVN